jgi:N-acetylmuramoyl-L-alanine amidase
MLSRRVAWIVPVTLLSLSVFWGCIASIGNTITPVGIVIHHLAVPPEVVPNLNFSDFDRLMYHIGYHFVVLPNGVVLRGRPERLRGAHASGYNNYLGICLVGDFSTLDNPDGKMGLMVPSEEQMRSLVNLIHEMQAKYAIPGQQILLHREANPRTECPGDRFNRDSLFKRLASREGL